MTGSSSSGNTKSTVTSEPSAQMSDFVAQMKNSILTPLISNFMPQLLEALKTGGAPNAQIPLVQNTVSALRKGTSSVTQGIKNMLAQSGLLNTPFGQRILAQTATSSEEQVSSVSPNVAASMISGVPGMINQTAGDIIGGLSGTGSKTSTGNNGAISTEAGGTASAAGGLLASLAPSISSLLPFGGAAAGGTAGGFAAGGVASGAAAGALGAGLDTSLLELAPLALLAL